MSHTASRHRLPKDRAAVVTTFDIAGHEGTLRVGLYEDGSIGEVFIKMSKSGSTMSGMMDSFATAVSIALQYGVPLDVLAEKFVDASFEPAGITHDRDIPTARSVVDYVFRWLVLFEQRRSAKPT